MPFANGSAVELYYVFLTAGGAIPATPTWKPIRFVSENLGRNTTEITSNEITTGRQKPRNKQGTYSSTATVQVELSSGSFDELIQAAFQGTWAANILKVGSTRRKMAILERHTDINQDYIAMGMEVSGLTLNAPVNSPVNLTFDLSGASLEPLATLPTGSTFDSPTSTEIMVTTEGFFKEDGTTIGYATDFSINFNNNMSPNFVLFQREAYDQSNEVFSCGGSFSAGFVDETLYDKFLNQTQTNIEVKLTDGTKSLTIELPNAAYTNGDKAVGGPGSIIANYTFTAGYDSSESTTAKVTRVV